MDEAINLIEQAFGSIVADLKTHQMVQKAWADIKAELEPTKLATVKTNSAQTS